MFNQIINKKDKTFDSNDHGKSIHEPDTLLFNNLNDNQIPQTNESVSSKSLEDNIAAQPPLNLAALGQDFINRIKSFNNNTADGSIFNLYLPYRTTIQNDPKKLAEYEKQVTSIINGADIRLGATFAFSNDSHANANTVNNIYQEYASNGWKYLLAAKLVDAFHGNSNLLSMGTQDLKILVAPITSNNTNVGGFYNPVGQFIVIDPNILLQLAVNTNDGSDVLVHEFSHKLDESDGTSDGFLPLMSQEQKNLFVHERETLFSMFQQGANTGISNYAFTNNQEFTAELMSTFYEAPNSIKNIDSGNLYNLLNNIVNADLVSQTNSTDGNTTVEDPPNSEAVITKTIGEYYTNLLNRQGSPGEIEGWKTFIRNNPGTTLTDVRNYFIGSSEMRNVLGQNYQSLLGRKGSSREIEECKNYLKSNQSINIGNIRSNMINSNEMTKAIKNRLITLGKSPNTNEIEQWKNYLRNNPNSNLTNVGLKTSK